MLTEHGAVRFAAASFAYVVQYTPEHTMLAVT